MRRRLDLAAGLILATPVLFLDEPTTGLDPRGRAEVWNGRPRPGLPGDDRAADHAVSGGGRPARPPRHRGPRRPPGRRGLPRGAEEIDRSAATGWTIVVHDPAGPRSRRPRPARPGAETDRDTRRVSAPAPDRMATLTTVVQRPGGGGGSPPPTWRSCRPTLDEVFLELTRSAA